MGNFSGRYIREICNGWFTFNTLHWLFWCQLGQGGKFQLYVLFFGTNADGMWYCDIWRHVIFSRIYTANAYFHFMFHSGTRQMRFMAVHIYILYAELTSFERRPRYITANWRFFTLCKNDLTSLHSVSLLMPRRSQPYFLQIIRQIFQDESHGIFRIA